MARGPQVRNSYNTRNSEASGKFIRAAIGKVGLNGKVSESDIREFQLNPTSIEDSKSSNWVAHNIPGQSDPIYQWVSGGQRVVSFQLLVTKDTSYYPKNINSESPNGLLGQALNIAGGVAAQFFNANIPPLGDMLGMFTGAGNGNQLSITKDLEWYQKLLYPTYSGGQLKSSPPLVVLYMGSTLEYSPKIEPSVYIVLDIKINITKQLPSLDPMEATVDFKLAEYPIKSMYEETLLDGLPASVSSFKAYVV